ncbi:MAG: DUF2007 domain-containing protein [Clostridia bacterium]|nr:DUF2007 domain-containing protein [Clostridia bacterium]
MDRFFGLDSVSPHSDKFELLISVTDNVQLAIIESILKNSKIPYFSKERGSGAAVKVIAGFSIFGTDVFVLKEDFEKAAELLGAMRESSVVKTDGENSED